MYSANVSSNRHLIFYIILFHSQAGEEVLSHFEEGLIKPSYSLIAGLYKINEAMKSVTDKKSSGKVNFTCFWRKKFTNGSFKYLNFNFKEVTNKCQI